MASWTFDSDAQGWTGGSGVWTGAEGHGVGCMVGEAAIGSLSIPVNVDDPVSFWYKITVPAAEDGGHIGQLDVAFLMGGAGGTLNIDSITVDTLPFDSGWLKFNGVSGDTGTTTSLAFDATTTPDNMNAVFYFDSVYVAEAEPGGAGFTRSAGGIPGGVMI